MSEIVPVDFGKEQREAARRLARLLGLVEARDAEMLANPKKYFDQAADEIIRLQRLVFEARKALWSRPGPFISRRVDYVELQTVVVERGEYERLRRAADIITQDCSQS